MKCMDWLKDGTTWPLEQFGALERNPDAVWRWSLGPESFVRAPGEGHSGKVYFRFAIPKAATSVEVASSGGETRTYTANRDWEEFAGSVAVAGGPWSVRFRTTPWLPPRNAERPLALVFHALFFRPEGGVSAKKVTDRRLCPLPFQKLESPSPTFAPCCRWWIEDELFYESHSETDPWNSEAAQKLRESQFDGSYRYCKLELCKAELVAPEKLGPEALARQAKLRHGPHTIALTADPRCNLACPSCRPHKVTQLTTQEEARLPVADALLERYAQDLRTLVLATDGEVFFSPYLRATLQRATRERFPSLEGIEILSNGILFDEKNVKELQPGSENIRWARVSIDAGDAASYARTRGGDWERLQRNLEWISRERKRGRFERFALNFVVQKSNYASLPTLFERAQELGVDELYFSPLLPWPRMKASLAEEAVCGSQHEEHKKWNELWSSLTERNWPFQIVAKW